MATIDERIKNDVLAHLGKGLSVARLCEETGLSYDELCKLADEFGSLHQELVRWYPKYDFAVKGADNDVHKGKQTGGKSKRVSE